MLPSKKRLSRAQFSSFLASPSLGSVFNKLGTLKHKKSLENKASIVISSKVEKKAVRRNYIRRRLYQVFMEYFLSSATKGEYVLYLSKQASKFTREDLKTALYDLLKKTP